MSSEISCICYNSILPVLRFLVDIMYDDYESNLVSQRATKWPSITIKCSTIFLNNINLLKMNGLSMIMEQVKDIKRHRQWCFNRFQIMGFSLVILVLSTEPLFRYILELFLHIIGLKSWGMLLLHIHNVFSSHFHASNHMGTKLFNKPKNFKKKRSKQ